uniref:Uncharacterized protein n=1 Tax=Phlebotomus papatasi TaxID=29031 RepID=A0A1B0D9G2_PHLPP
MMPDLQRSQAAYKGQLSTLRTRLDKFLDNSTALQEDGALKELYIIRESLDRVEEKYTQQARALIQQAASETEKKQFEADLQVVKDECFSLMTSITELIAEVKLNKSLNNSADVSGAHAPSVQPDFSGLIRALQASVEEQQKQRVANSSTIEELLKKQNEEMQLMLTKGSSGTEDVEKVQVPHFSGDYLEWRSFHDVFVSVVHSRKHLSNTQKMTHLKSVLKGDAAQVISALTICEENYEAAWAAVRRQYDNKRSMVAAHIDVFMKQNAVTTASAAAIKKLQTRSSSVIQTLDSLSVTQKDPWLIMHVLSKLDPETKSLWSREKFDDIPTWSQFEEFLINRWRELEQCALVNSKSSGNQDCIDANPFLLCRSKREWKLYGL